MNNNEIENKPNPEDIIFDEIISSKELNIENVSDKELEGLIKEKIEKANYLSEWQVDYAMERIMDRIKDSKNKKIVKEKVSVSKKIIYGFFLAVFLMIGAGVWTWKLSTILSIIISII